MCGTYPDADELAAGTEVSSTYEGRHITVLESEITHPSHTDGFVDKGDPCVVGLNIVGVAFKSAAAATDLIALDTEGIWVMDVNAADDGGNVAVAPGDRLYINTTTCAISKIATAATQIPFGYALGSVTSGNTDTIAVKVHWDPVDNAVLDSEPIFFGDARDASIKWDGTNLVLLPLVDDTGAFVMGDGTTDMDLLIYMGSTDILAEFDVSAGNFETKQLQHKYHLHDEAVDTYLMELKYNFQGTTAQAFGLDCTCEIEPGGATPANRTAGGLRALQGVARLAAGFTSIAGSDAGVYGQFCNDGTLNGANNYPAAGYFLIEDGGTWTQVGWAQVLWLDSHLAQAISAGNSTFLNITNNGSVAQWGSAIHVYAGNLITNLLSIETATGMVSAETTADYTFSNYVKIKIDVDGTTYYLIADRT